MSYYKKQYVRRVRRDGLGGVENCGADQVWDSRLEYLGQKGQCVPRGNYTSSQLENPNAYPTSVKVAAAQASSGGGGIGKGISDLIGSLLASKVAPSSPQVVIAPQSSGLSPTTVAVGAAAAIGILYFALKD